MTLGSFSPPNMLPTILLSTYLRYRCSRICVGRSVGGIEAYRSSERITRMFMCRWALGRPYLERSKPTAKLCKSDQDIALSRIALCTCGYKYVRRRIPTSPAAPLAQDSVTIRTTAQQPIRGGDDENGNWQTGPRHTRLDDTLYQQAADDLQCFFVGTQVISGGHRWGPTRTEAQLALLAPYHSGIREWVTVAHEAEPTSELKSVIRRP